MTQTRTSSKYIAVFGEVAFEFMNQSIEYLTVGIAPSKGACSKDLF